MKQNMRSYELEIILHTLLIDVHHDICFININQYSRTVLPVSYTLAVVICEQHECNNYSVSGISSMTISPEANPVA
jgi:hypothetical protein